MSPAFFSTAHPTPSDGRNTWVVRKLLPNIALVAAAVLTVAVLVTGRPDARTKSVTVSTAAIPDPNSDLALVLIPPTGDTPADREISDLQEKIKQAPEQAALLERLGWTYVNLARVTNDPGFYKLAEQCAVAIAKRAPDSADAALLRGHVYEALHRFGDAEKTARDLVARRQFVFDYALLGDSLMEQGSLTEAVEAYQKMIDLKPCLQTYSRIAHMRWLKGDLPGAIEIARVAAAAGSPREPEPTAWAFTRLGIYSLQRGDFPAARKASDLALDLVPDFAPALLLRGKIFSAQSAPAEAVKAFEIAAEKNPVPEYLWALADALRADQRDSEAGQVEAKIHATGRSNDPRTFAIYLATRHTGAALSLELSQAELENRRDIFTLDALAWAQLANGDLKAARTNSALALAEGTQDARLFYHAAAIAAASRNGAGALEFSRKADAIRQMLLPSERAGLDRQIAALTSGISTISSR